MLTRRVFVALLWIVLVLTACANPALEPAEGFLAVPGGRVWYRVVGSGRATPLLVLHSGPGASSLDEPEAFAAAIRGFLREAETAP